MKPVLQPLQLNSLRRFNFSRTKEKLKQRWTKKLKLTAALRYSYICVTNAAVNTALKKKRNWYITTLFLSGYNFRDSEHEHMDTYKIATTPGYAPRVIK